MEQQNQELDNLKKIVEKIIDNEVKINLLPAFLFCKIDQWFFCRNQYTYIIIIKVYILNVLIKNSSIKNTKSKKLIALLVLHFKNLNTSFKKA